MKNLLIFSTITILALSTILITPKATAANVAVTICEYVASDDKKRLRSFLKSNKLKIRRIFKDIKCNGQNLLEFAVASGSEKTGSMMISKLPKKVVSANLDVLKTGTQPLIDTANDRLGN